MSLLLDSLEDKLALINHILESVPFTNDQEASKFFLNVYNVDHESLSRLNKEPETFPIDANKLLKFGISLGNLLKSLEQDELLVPQLTQTRVPSLSSFRPDNSWSKPDESNPFVDSSKKLPSLPQQPAYYVKFMKNLLIILKNFNIGTFNYSSIHSSKRRLLDSSANNHSSSTINTNNSPIKLSSRQLLIEKLEINIELDNLFIYKLLFQLCSTIMKIILNNLIETYGQEYFYAQSSNSTLANVSADEISSVFSGVSSNSWDSSNIDGYLKLVAETLNRIVAGFIDPFIRLLLNDIVKEGVDTEFHILLNSL